jgi:hypothetical protein
MKKFIYAALVLALAGCGVNAKQGGMAPAKNTGFFGSAKADLDVMEEEVFAGKKDVIIGAFRVGFITYNKVGHKTGGGMFGGSRGSAKAKSTLIGVDESTMQAITDAAYADFVSTLKANGYNVLDRDRLISTAEYKKMSTAPSPYKTDIGSADVTYLAPKGMPIKSNGMSFGAFSAPNTSMPYAAQKAGAAVIDVDYVVNFVQGEGAGYSVATVEVGQGISVDAGNGLTFYGGNPGMTSMDVGSIKLGQPVYSTEEFATVTDTSSATGQALGYAANVVSYALGGGGSVVKSYEFKASPAKYKAISTKVLADANKRLIGGMAANR